MTFQSISLSASSRHVHFTNPSGLRADLQTQSRTTCSLPSPVNPWESFYDINQCHDKGRDRSPTFDDAGFQLDYNRVCGWKKPQAYNKQKMIRVMDRAVAKSQSQTEQIFSLFSTAKWNDKEGIEHIVKDYVKDHISKDLGIPWHQIGPQQVRLWKDKGFESVKFEDWWQEPNEVERNRTRKMSSESILRKNVWPPGTEPKKEEPRSKKQKR